jgi:MarR family transcriptional regulator for hemolysin
MTDDPPNPEQLHARLAQLIGQVSRLWRRRVDEHLQPFGMTEATWLPLFYLAQAPAAMRQRALAGQLQLDSSSVVRTLDALEAAALIDRREDPGDRRAKAIVLTAQGRKLALQVENAVREVRRELLFGISPADMLVATQLLETVQQRLAPSKPDAPP